jgi:hypothetical protein
MQMKTIFKILGLLIIPAVFMGTSLGQDLIVYPAQGQDAAQVEKDKEECFAWARQETGFDPSASADVPSAPEVDRSRRGEVARGAARGALVGAVAGEIIDDDAGKGAAAGAAAGALGGRFKRKDRIREQEKTRQQQEEQQQKYIEQKQSDFNRAYSACLEAKGYSVK